MSNTKIILEVNDDGVLVLPVTRCEVGLPPLSKCPGLRHSVLIQGDNERWYYTRKHYNIRFETTKREIKKMIEEYVPYYPTLDEILAVNARVFKRP